MNSRTVTITRFPLPDGISHEQLKAGFEEAGPHFARVPGLMQKAFLVSEDGGSAGGSYLWETEEQARSFSENALREMIRERFGVECEIEYFSAPVVVEGGGSIEPRGGDLQRS